jgi:lysozyme
MSPTGARLAVLGISGLFAVAITAAPGVVDDEGWLLKTYRDPVGISTGCAGVTGVRYGIEPGKSYTQAQCEEKTALALLDHAIETRRCLPSGIPVDTHAAFLRFGYNVGAAKFCASTLSRKARAGDLPGACAELSKWIYAGGKVWPGLVERRKRERAQCERGLA